MAILVISHVIKSISYEPQVLHLINSETDILSYKIYACFFTAENANIYISNIQIDSTVKVSIGVIIYLQIILLLSD